MERFGRSWELLKACFAVLRDDKELMLFPVLSGFSALLVLATFALPLFFTQAFSQGFGLFGMLVAFAFYFSQYLVIFYFNAALVGAALKRMEGGDPTLSDGIAIANENITAILAYAAIAATVATAPTATTAVEASLAMRRRYRLQFAREVWRWQVRLLQRMDRAIARDAGSAAGRAAPVFRDAPQGFLIRQDF